MPPHDYHSISQAGDNACFVLPQEILRQNAFRVSAAEIQGARPSQEDAMFLSAGVRIDDPEEYFRRNYQELVAQNRGKASGTTAAMYYLDFMRGRISVGNLGDSRVYLVIKDNSRVPAEYKTILLTQDQNPNSPRIRQHILDQGGFVLGGRVGGTLAVGGAIGDQDVADFLLTNPDISTFTFAELIRAAGVNTTVDNCEFKVINACDGLTDHDRDNNSEFVVEYQRNGDSRPANRVVTQKAEADMTAPNGRVSSLVKRWEEGDRALELSDFLVRDAAAFSGDNISVSVCEFVGRDLGRHDHGVFAGVFDGHGGSEVSRDCLDHMRGKVHQLRNLFVVVPPPPPPPPPPPHISVPPQSFAVSLRAQEMEEMSEIEFRHALEDVVEASDLDNVEIYEPFILRSDIIPDPALFTKMPLREAGVSILPIHNGRGHWVVVVVNHDSKEVICFDPKGNFPQTLGFTVGGRIFDEDNFLGSIFQDDAKDHYFVNNLHEQRYIPGVGIAVGRQIQRQDDSVNCGAYCALFVGELFGRELDTDRSDEMLDALANLDIAREREIFLDNNNRAPLYPPLPNSLPVLNSLQPVASVPPVSIQPPRNPSIPATAPRNYKAGKEAIGKYIEQNVDLYDQNLQAFKAGINEQKKLSLPSLVYRGTGLDLSRSDDGFIINEVFSPEVARFINPRNNKYISLQQGYIITSIQVGDGVEVDVSDLTNKEFTALIRSNEMITMKITDLDGESFSCCCDNRVNATSLFCRNDNGNYVSLLQQQANNTNLFDKMVDKTVDLGKTIKPEGLRRSGTPIFVGR